MFKLPRNRYKKQYDKKSKPVDYQLGDWVLVRFPHEETGKHRKLSRPWHGPYRITQRNDPDVTAVKVFFPDEGSIQVHQTRVCPCPDLPAGFYWYGGNRKSPGGVPRWLQQLLSTSPDMGLQQPPTCDVQAGGSERDELPVEDSDSEDCGDELPELPEQPESEQCTPPPVNTRYMLRDRSHGIRPPQRLM